MDATATHSRLADAWWAAAARKELLLQRCSRCTKAQFYPRGHCASCGSTSVDWETVTGNGRLVSYTAGRLIDTDEATGGAGHGLALVELDEGVTITARLTGDYGAARCDMPVRVVVSDSARLLLQVEVETA